MKRSEAMALAVLLLIAGFFTVMASVSGVEKDSVKRTVRSGSVWNFTEHFEAGDVLRIEIEASSDWGQLIPGEGEYAVYINVSVTDSVGGQLSLVYNYTAEPQVGYAPDLTLEGLQVTDNTASRSLGVDSKRYGVAVKQSGNFSVLLDKDSVFLNFFSTKPPRGMTVITYAVFSEYPYIFLLPIGCFFLLSCAATYFLKVRRKKVRASSKA